MSIYSLYFPPGLLAGMLTCFISPLSPSICRSRTSGTYRLSFVDSNAPSAPPPPVTSVPFVPISVGPTFPYKSSILDLSTGVAQGLPYQITSVCPDGYGAVLASSSYRKNIWKLTGLPASGKLDMNVCDMPSGQWDSLAMFLSCDTGTTTCTCFADDDGCGFAAGSSLTALTLQASKDYYFIVAPYSQ